MTKPFDIESLTLLAGKHDADTGEYCVMEAVAAHCGLPHTDRDVDAVCPRIEAYARALNDVMPDDQRQRLKAFITRLPNTKGTPEQDEQRRWMIQEAATAIFAASAMRAAGLTEHADKFAAAKVTDQASSTAWAAEAAQAAWAAWAAWAARAAQAAQAAQAAGAAQAAQAAGAARAAQAAQAAWAARAAGAAWDAAIDLLDRLIRVTEDQP